MKTTKQTRRSISVSRAVHARALAFAQEKGLPLAQLTVVALAHAVENFYRNDGLGCQPARKP